MPAETYNPLSKHEWVRRYGGWDLLNEERSVVLPCDPQKCDDSVCHGWRVVNRLPITVGEAFRIVTACQELCWQFEGGPTCVGAAFHLGLISLMERLTVYAVLGWPEA